jgi:hypothetical protein
MMLLHAAKMQLRLAPALATLATLPPLPFLARSAWDLKDSECLVWKYEMQRRGPVVC